MLSSLQLTFQFFFIDFLCRFYMVLIQYFVKSVRIRSYSGPYFPAFELNTEKNMEYDCHIFSKYLVFQMKNLVFQSKYLVFRSKYQVFHTLNLKYQVFRAKYLVFRKLGISTKQPVPGSLLCPLVIFTCCKCSDGN